MLASSSAVRKSALSAQPLPFRFNELGNLLRIVPIQFENWKPVINQRPGAPDVVVRGVHIARRPAKRPMHVVVEPLTLLPTCAVLQKEPCQCYVPCIYGEVEPRSIPI